MQLKSQNLQSNTKIGFLGYLSYDLKNDTERLTSANVEWIEFPLNLFFFQA